MSAPTLGGVTVPNATVSDAEEVFVGKQRQAHDGTLLTHYTAIKLAWKVQAAGLTEAQRDTLKAEVDDTASQTYVDVDGNSYTVVVLRGTWRARPTPVIGSTDILFDVEFGLEEES